LQSPQVYIKALQKAGVSDGEIRENWLKLFRMYSVVSKIADNPNQQSNLARVEVRYWNRDDAKKIADNIEEAYNEVRRNTQVSALQVASERVKVQMKGAEDELSTAEMAVQAFKEKSNITELGAVTQTNIVYEKEVRAKYEQAVAELGASNRQVATLKEAVQRLPKTIEAGRTVSTNPAYTQIEVRLSEARVERAGLLGKFADDAPQVKAIEATIAQLEKDLAAQKGSQYQKNSWTQGPDQVALTMLQRYEEAKAQNAFLTKLADNYKSQLSDQTSRLSAIPANERQLIDLIRSRDILDLKVRQLRSTSEELKNRSAVEPPKVQAIGNQGAIAEEEPKEPNYGRNILLGLLGGVTLGILYSISIESLRPRAYSSEQLAQTTGLSVVAALPKLRTAEAMLAKALATSGTPVESFRHLAAAGLSGDDRHSGIVVFTSVGTTGGSSLSALNYAFAMGEAGMKVLVVDAEPLGILTKSLGATDKNGLSEMAAAEVSMFACEGSLVPTAQPNVQFLPAGKARNRLSTWPGERLEALSEALKALADIVVIVTAPCTTLADASRIVRYSNETFVVFSAAKTVLTTVSAAARMLQDAGAKRVSIVLVADVSTEEPFYASTRSLPAQTN
jgi:receptor protein-tyrosine kinase